MISIDELKYTINRLELLEKNIDIPEEQVMSNILIMNLKQIIQQANIITNSNEFKEMVKEKINNVISDS